MSEFVGYVLWYLATRHWGRQPWRAVRHSSLRSLKLLTEVLSDTVGWLCSLCHWRWVKKKKYASKFRSTWWKTFPFLLLATSANTMHFASYVRPTLATLLGHCLTFDIWHPASLASTLHTAPALFYPFCSVFEGILDNDGSSTHLATPNRKVIFL